MFMMKSLLLVSLVLISSCSSVEVYEAGDDRLSYCEYLGEVRVAEATIGSAGRGKALKSLVADVEKLDGDALSCCYSESGKLEEQCWPARNGEVYCETYYLGRAYRCGK